MLPLHKISSVVITYNSEATLDLVLSSLKPISAEIVLLDSGSTDGTLRIAGNHNCRIYYRAFTGYGEQKVYAVSLASNDWILSVDADEVLSSEIQKEIFEHFNQETVEYNGFYLPIALVFLKKVFRYGAESQTLRLRIFNKKSGNFNNDSLHEKVELKGKTIELKNKILHYSYFNIEHYFNKFNKYSSFAANKIILKNHPLLITKIILIGPWKFFQGYFIKLNFLNGFPGFIWSLFSAYYSVVKYVKIYELKYLKTK